MRRPRFDPWAGKIPWRRKWQPTPVFLSCLENSMDRGDRQVQSLGSKESTTERLTFASHMYATSSLSICRWAFRLLPCLGYCG